MPPCTSERRHYHEHARQFFYVLSGRLTLEFDAGEVLLETRDGVEVAAGLPHQARNDGDNPAEFLVISAPSTEHDRVEL